MSMPFTDKMVLVIWKDASMLLDGSYWHSGDEAIGHMPVTVYSTGFLVVREKDRITLAQAIHDAEQIGGVFSIPMDWVQEVIALKRA
jgi:hypothetical protein